MSNGQGYLVDVIVPDRWTVGPSAFLRGTAQERAGTYVVAYNDWQLYVVWDFDRVGGRAMESDGLRNVRVQDKRVEGVADVVIKGGAPHPFLLNVDDVNFPAIPWNKE